MRWRRGRRIRRKKIRTWAFALLVILISVHAIQENILISARVDGSAMEPSLRPRDTVYGTKAIYGSQKGLARLIPQRRDARPVYGDIVYMQSPHASARSLPARVLDVCVRFFTFQRVAIFHEGMLIRRVIALPGDTIRMDNFQFFVSPLGTEHFVSELAHSSRPYEISYAPLPPRWESHYPFSADMTEQTIPHGHYFVAADNRVGALDSRVWRAIPYDQIIAPVFFRYRFPFGFSRM